MYVCIEDLSGCAHHRCSSSWSVLVLETLWVAIALLCIAVCVTHISMTNVGLPVGEVAQTQKW